MSRQIRSVSGFMPECHFVEDGTEIYVYYGQRPLLNSDGTIGFVNVYDSNGKVQAAWGGIPNGGTYDETAGTCTVTLTNGDVMSGTLLKSGSNFTLDNLVVLSGPVQLDSPTFTTSSTVDSVRVLNLASDNASGYLVRYSTDLNDWSEVEVESNSVVINGLASGTVYYLQAKALVDGESFTDSEWSSSVTQQTASVLAMPSINVSVVDRTTIRITGLSVANALGYQVKVGTLSGYQTVEQCAPVNGVIEFPNKWPRAVYYVSARALGNDGDYITSDWSDEISVATGAQVNTELPQPQVVISTESFTALKATGLTAYKSYRYQIAESVEGLESAPFEMVGTSDGIVYLMGLEPGTTYYARFCLVDGSKCSIWSDAVSATTTAVTNTIVVTSGSDSGAGTLRQATYDATDGTKIVLNVAEIVVNSVVGDSTKHLFIVGGLEEKTVIRAGNNNQILNGQYYDWKRVIVTGNSGTAQGVRYGRWSDCELEITSKGSSPCLDIFGYNVAVYNCVSKSHGCIKKGVLVKSVFIGNTAVSYNGGGAYQATLSNCVFTGNSAIYGGGAYECTVTNCVFTGNSATNGGGANQCTATNCVFTGNSATYGGGACRGTLNGCVLNSNTSTSGGGGVTQATLYDCAIHNNTSDFRGGGLHFCSAFNCDIQGNNGYGAYDSSLENCLIVGNKTDSNIAGDVQTLSTVITLRGCTAGVIYGAAEYICAYNTLWKSVSNTPSGANVSNLCYDGQENDFFMNYEQGDYRLKPESPAVDAGDNEYATMTTDLDGNARISGDNIDVGCYEYTPLQLNKPVLNIVVEDGSITISFSLPDYCDGLYIEYSHNSSFTNTGSVTATSTGFVIPGLNNDTYIRAKYLGQSGLSLDSEWSDVFHYYLDTTAPTVVVNSGTIVMERGSSIDFLSDVSVSDDSGEDLTASYQILDSDDTPVVIGGIDTNIPSASVPVGEYTIVFTATDSAGNTGTAERSLTVVPTVLSTPIISVADATVDSITIAGLSNNNASGWKLSVNGIENNVSPAEDGTYVIENLSVSRVYTIKVKALGDGLDYDDSHWSNVLSASTSKAILVYSDLHLAVAPSGAFCAVRKIDLDSRVPDNGVAGQVLMWTEDGPKWVSR